MNRKYDMLLTGLLWTAGAAALSFSCAGSLLGQLLMFAFTGWFGVFMIALWLKDNLKETR